MRTPLSKRTSIVEVTQAGKPPSLVMTFASVPDLHAAADYVRKLGTGASPQLSAEHQQLCEFYGVGTLEALVDAQVRHVRRLQEQATPTRDESPRTPREG